MNLEPVKCEKCGFLKKYVKIENKKINANGKGIKQDTTLYNCLKIANADMTKAPWILPPCHICESEKETRKLQAEYNKQFADRLFKDAGIWKRYENKTFENYISNEQSSLIYFKCADFAENIGRHIADGTWLQMAGNSGTGKTHLVVAIIKSCCRAGYTAKYITENRLYEKVKDIYNQDRNHKYNLKMELEETDLLTIDEIGASERSGHDETILNKLCLNRHNRQKAIIFISNLQKHLFKMRLGAAIIDRIETEPLIFNWESYRGMK